MFSWHWVGSHLHVAGLWLRFQVAGCMKLVGRELPCKNSCLSLLLIAWHVLRGGTSGTLQQKNSILMKNIFHKYFLFSYRFIARHMSKAKPINSIARTHGAYNVTWWCHTDDVNQCLHNKSSSPWIPNSNLFNFTFLPVDFSEVLCSPANELQQNSNASFREEYTPQNCLFFYRFLARHMSKAKPMDTGVQYSIARTHSAYNEIWVEVFIESSHNRVNVTNVSDSVATFWPWYLSSIEVW